MDRQSNVWLGVRFNITRIPFIILIENKKMYHFHNQFEESVVLKFIEDEKLIEDSMDIPENIGIANKANVIMRELTERIKTAMLLLFDKYGIKIYWNNIMTYIFLVIILIIFIYLENKLIVGIRKLCNFDKLKNNENPSESKEILNNKERKEKKENNRKTEIKDNKNNDYKNANEKKKKKE